MRNRAAAMYDSSGQPPRRVGAIRSLLGLALLMVGGMLARCSAICTGVGRRWLGEQTVRAWVEALDYFRGSATGAQKASPVWEQRFGRVGASVVLCIIGALVVLWTFLLIGGTLAWLATHGYGFYLLLGTVTIGTLLGIVLARQGRRSGERDRLN